jgi:hypothetical protein
MRNKPKVKAKIKQLQAIAKAASKAVITTSTNMALNKLDMSKGIIDLRERLKEIQRRYGVQDCLDVFPDILKRIEERPHVDVSVPHPKGGTRKIKVKLFWLPLKMWIDSFDPKNTLDPIEDKIPDRVLILLDRICKLRSMRSKELL